MRFEDGRYFYPVDTYPGSKPLVDNNLTGKDFVPNRIDVNKPTNVGDHIIVGRNIYEYMGEDNLEPTHSIFRWVGFAPTPPADIIC